MSGPPREERVAGAESGALDDAARLRARVAELEETLNAILNGEVDALVVNTSGEERLFTLQGADAPYRVLVEQMREGALTVDAGGMILYANRRFAEMLGVPLERVTGVPLMGFADAADREALQGLLCVAPDGTDASRGEVRFTHASGRSIPTYVSASALSDDEAGPQTCVLVTDLTEQKQAEIVALSERKHRLMTAVNDAVRGRGEAREAARGGDLAGRIVQVLAEEFHVARCLLARMDADGGQWVVEHQHARQGVEPVTGRREPSDFGPAAFGAELRAGRTVAVNDMDGDPRLDGTARTPLAELHVRSLLYVPHPPDESPTVVLALQDTAPRGWSAEDLALMEQVAERVWAALRAEQGSEALRESEERLDAIFRQTAAGLAQTDLDGQFVLVNDTYCRLVGRSREELLALRMQDMTHAEDLPRNLEGFRDAVESGEDFSIEKRYVRPDGSQVWVRNNVSVVRDAAGRPQYVLAASFDLTERKRDENERLRLASIVENSPDFIGISDVEGNPLFLNRAGRKLVGLSETHDVRQTAIPDYFVPEERAFVAEVVVPAIMKDGRWAGELTFRHFGTGAAIPVFYDLFRVDDPQTGKPVNFATVTRDITESKRADLTLRESEQRFRVMADSIPQLAWMADGEGSIFWYNRQWYEYTGTTLEQMQGWGWKSVHHPDHLDRVVEKVSHHFRNGLTWEDTFPLRGADGEYRWFLSRMTPIQDESGRVVLFFGTNTDVTEQRQIIEERGRLLAAERTARSEAERVSRMKDEFVATLSHELRTPLNAILGWSHIISRGAMRAEDLQQGLETIQRNAKVQIQMVEDLLDVSRITSGKVRLDVQRLGLCAVIDAAVEAIRPASDAKGIRIQKLLDCAADEVNGDPNRLQQVVWNLLTNAVKFTPKGGRIQVLLERVNSHVELSVTDNGVGISPEFLPYVFDRFRQSDQSTTRRFGGLGLGLAIVKHLAELHGGTVRAKSAGEGQGATFVMDLPLSLARRPRRARPGGAPLEPAVSDLGTADDGAPILTGIKVVYVDDEPDARELVRRILSEQGARIITAGSAAEGRRLLVEERPDVLIADIGMPDEDGYDLIRTVRALSPDRGGRTPAAAVTALARSEDRQRALLAGFHTHVAKPVEPTELVAVVASLAGRTGQPRQRREEH